MERDMYFAIHRESVFTISMAWPGMLLCSLPIHFSNGIQLLRALPAYSSKAGRYSEKNKIRI